MKSKVYIIIAMVFVAALASVIFIFGKDDSNIQNERLISAEEFYEKCDYDNAIAIYNAVISSDDSCAEAYSGLADAYWAKNNADKALQILERGMLNTDNDELVLDKMKELFPDLSYEEAVTVTVSVTEQTEVSAPEATTVSEATESITETSSNKEEEVSTAETQPKTSEETTTAAQTTKETVQTTPPQTKATTTTAETTVPKTDTAKTTTSEVTETAEEEKPTVEVPDFTNMTYDEAYLWCSFNSLRIKGIGLDYFDEIKSQSPSPGTIVEENSVVYVKG